MLSALKSQCVEAAQLRYYVYVGRIGEMFRYSVCDGRADSGSKTLAKFSDREHAERFRKMVIGDYVREFAR